MIARKISRRNIFAKVISFVLITGFCFNGFAENTVRDMAARKKLVEKYKDHKILSASLKALLVNRLNYVKDKDREKVNKYFNAPHNIAAEKSGKATEALVDLLDFELGEIIGDRVMELISDRGRETILYLKKKISQKPLSSERKVKERDKDIVELIKTISGKTKVDESHFTTEEILRSHLYYVQLYLEKYYCKRGHYPNNLLEALPTLDYFEIGADEKFYYKSYGQIYFLCAFGEDGKFGTADDIKPPYNTDLFSFPEHFK